MHLIDPDVNFLGTSAIVGTGVPNATGVALAQKMKSTNNVVVCFLGDGATEEGCFYESLNFAGLHKLPILYVVENNKYAIHEPISKRLAIPELEPRASCFAVDFTKFSNGRIMELLETANLCIADIRRGLGPKLLEVDCYRWYQHVGPYQDFDQGYREEQEMDYWLKNDALLQMKQEVPSKNLAKIEKTVNDKIVAAFKFAEQSDFPEISELNSYVYR